MVDDVIQVEAVTGIVITNIAGTADLTVTVDIAVFLVGEVGLMIVCSVLTDVRTCVQHLNVHLDLMCLEV